MQTNQVPKLLKQAEVSQIIRKSPAWLERKRWEGGGLPYRKIGRNVFYEEAEVYKWIDEQPRMNSTSDKGEN